MVLESTYGDRLHEGRKARKEKLRQVLERTLANKGTTIVPAFSLGRTQELLYELNAFLERRERKKVSPGAAAGGGSPISHSPISHLPAGPGLPGRPEVQLGLQTFGKLIEQNYLRMRH